MASQNFIPVIDFERILANNELPNCLQMQEIHFAFSEVGFVLLKNHGIKSELVKKAFQVSLDFFNQSLEIKKKYMKQIGEKDTGNNGYIGMQEESVNPLMPGDLKECFNICAIENFVQAFPDKGLLELRIAMVELYESAIACSKKILEVMGYALQLEDPHFFVKRHRYSGHHGSYTTARTLYYPPLPSQVAIKPGQLRCGEHVDYGSITLLFQDPNGGLLVKKCGGDYIEVPYLEDAVLVNLGALMQNWTSDRYMATPHKVLLPEENKKNQARQSIAIFIHPDDEEVIKCVDGSDKYPPITAYEDTHQRLAKSFKY